MSVTLDHQSGRFDATDEEWWKMLDNLAVHADHITVTEAGSTRVRRLLAAWARDGGWHVWHPQGRGHDECAILSRFRPERTRSFRLTRLVLRTSRKAPICLTAAYYSEWGWLAVWHAPAHNEGLRAGLWATRVYLSALTGLRVARTRMRGPVTFAADWNLDLRRARWRRLLAAPYPGMTWGAWAGQRGTHGPRVIDGHLTNKPITGSSVTLGKQRGFDHAPVRTVVK